MAKAFPKTLYVKVEDGGTGPDYFGTYSAAIEAAELGEKIKVGLYTLTETIEVKGVAVTNTVKKHKRS